MLVVLRDGRKLIGVLRSYDQFGEIEIPAWLLWLVVSHLDAVDIIWRWAFLLDMAAFIPQYSFHLPVFI